MDGLLLFFLVSEVNYTRIGDACLCSGILFKELVYVRRLLNEETGSIDEGTFSFLKSENSLVCFDRNDFWLYIIFEFNNIFHCRSWNYRQLTLFDFAIFTLCWFLYTHTPGSQWMVIEHWGVIVVNLVLIRLQNI